MRNLIRRGSAAIRIPEGRRAVISICFTEGWRTKNTGKRHAGCCMKGDGETAEKKDPLFKKGPLPSHCLVKGKTLE